MKFQVQKSENYSKVHMKGYHLFSYFKITSLVSIVVILLVAYFGLSNILRCLIIREAEKNSIQISRMLRDYEFDNYIELDKNGDSMLSKIPFSKQREIDKNLKIFTEAFDIAKIKIYNLEPIIIYSTDTDIIGELDPNNNSLLRALDGIVSSKKQSKDDVWDLNDEKRVDTDIVETYIPIYGHNGKIIGSFEIYRDIANDLMRADIIHIRSWSVLAITVLSVFGLLMLVINRAVKTIKVNTSDLFETNRKLNQEITDRKRLEKELLSIVERERKRIGQELHDSIGQQLTGISFMAQKLEKTLLHKSLDKEIPYAERIESCVSLAAEQVRNIAKGLHPVDLDRNGLFEAIKELTANTEEMFNVSCSIKYDHNISVDDISVAINLYRITQEAITNAVKHGKTKNIIIELFSINNNLKLVIENDGIDFSLDRTNIMGMGLRLMRYRAESMNGTFSICARPGGGSIISCVFPRKKINDLKER